MGLNFVDWLRIFLPLLHKKQKTSKVGFDKYNEVVKNNNEKVKMDIKNEKMN